MATASTHVYSLGSLTGPIPFAQVIRTLLKCVHDKTLNERHLSRSLATTAEQWTQKRIEYLAAVRGDISHKDTRLFDYDHIQGMKKIESYDDLINFLNRCNEQKGFRYEREY